MVLKFMIKWSFKELWRLFETQIHIQISQRVANNQFTDKNTSLQKFAILLIIRGVSPT